MYASDSVGAARALHVRELDGAVSETVSFPAPIDRFLDGGAMWFDVETTDGELTVRGVAWTVEAPEAVRPTAVVICTFNRVEDCLNTLGALAGDPAPTEIIDAVYVVDQGTDAVSSRPRFAEVEAQLGSRLRYLRQPNLGGAGGFTRGLLEVTDAASDLDGDHANVLFMDDDVICEPDIVVRMTAFANRTTAPVIVGGQMLYLMHPDQLHVSAERADLAQLAPGVAVAESLHATSLTKDREWATRRLDLRVDAGYNAWWSCLIPSEVVRACGYPLPVFFQWDDIEYGIRARELGFPTTTLPGAGVWHADFSLKDWDDWARYFSFRNSMITGALHGPRPAGYLAKVMARQLAKELIGMQYGLAATCIKAIEDFLAGPAGLRDGGQQAAQDVRALRAKYPDTVKHAAWDVPGVPGGDYSIIDAAPEPKPSMLNAVYLKRVIYTLLGRRPFPFGRGARPRQPVVARVAVPARRRHRFLTGGCPAARVRPGHHCPADPRGGGGPEAAVPGGRVGRPGLPGRDAGADRPGELAPAHDRRLSGAGSGRRSTPPVRGAGNAPAGRVG